MRRLGRILRRFLTGVSVLLLLATLAAWARGCWAWDNIWVSRESLDGNNWCERCWHVDWSRGEIGLRSCLYRASAAEATRKRIPSGVRWQCRHEAEPAGSVTRHYTAYTKPPPWGDPGAWAWDGAGVVVGRWTAPARMYLARGATLIDAQSEQLNVAFPCWMAAVLFALLPAGQACGLAREIKQRRREKAGRCAACGYDLRATPEGGGALLERCPECGRVRA